MLSILGIVAIVVFTIQVYKTANGMERNGAIWAIITAAIGIGFQLVIPIMVGIVIGVYLVASGGSPEDIESAVGTWATLLGIGSFIISLVGMWLVMRYVSRVPDTPSGIAAPPAPPQF